MRFLSANGKRLCILEKSVSGKNMEMRVPVFGQRTACFALLKPGQLDAIIRDRTKIRGIGRLKGIV